MNSPVITRFILKKNSRSFTRNLQNVHHHIARHAHSHRTLWAHPRSEILAVQAPYPLPSDTFPGIVTEHHTAPVQTRYETGAPINFGLIAHPTKSEFIRGRRGKPIPLPQQEWEQWVTRKLGPAMNIASVEFEDLGTRTAFKRGHRVTHRWVSFSGQATVQDPEYLQALITEGVGRGKAYGAGLLLISERKTL